jgi:hypothetical protein
MTDLKPAPAWHTTAASDQLAEARAEITRLTDSVRWVEHCRAQAEERLDAEKNATSTAEEKIDVEANRADGAEAHLHNVLLEFVVEPAARALDGISDGVDAADVPQNTLDSVAECLKEDLDGGMKAGDLAESARDRLNDWADERR